MIGRQISRYRIVEQIGSGGMSVVYKGHDTSLDRDVAVKVLHPHLAAKEDSRRRFSREARAVARLHHPNILEIYDFSGDDAADAFIVTEYIRGHTLRGFAEKQRFDPPEIAAMAVHALASALDHAHQTGVIHRDLKPDNVMIREDGVLKLMDFGIAKVLDRDEKMTMTGALVGSPAHMAPEIIEGVEAGREADIFSLGTILYWLCCAKLPFQGNNTTQTLKLILDGTYPDPRIANGAVSDALAGIVAKCLAREPKARYGSAGELRDALEKALHESGLARPEEELAAFFADPDGYKPRLRARLVSSLTEDAEKAISERKEARALDHLNRVLALEPSNPKATQLIEAMKHRRKRKKQLATAGLSLGGAVVVAGLGYGAFSFMNRPQPLTPPVQEVVTAREPEPVKKPVEIAPDPVVKPPQPTGEEKPVVREPEKPVLAAHRDPEPKKPGTNRGEKKDVKVAALEKPEPVKTGNLAIKVYPYAPITLDGTVVNITTPNFEGQVPVGRHHIRIVGQCCKTFERDVEVVPGGPGPVVFARLDPKPALLAIASATPVNVMVQNVYRGTSAASEKDPITVPLPEGAYRGRVSLRLYQDGFRDKELTEEFEAGGLKTIQVELEKL